MQEKDIITINATDQKFPSVFKELGLSQQCKEIDALGNIELLESRPRVGIVGSRKMTSYGKEVTRNLAQAAARAGVTVVSGLAFGVDAVAHHAALETNGKTIAVLPSNLRKIYPACHEPLARRIVQKNGLLISEYKRWLPLRHYFVERNRLIAALSEVIVIVEAAYSSGTEHTFQAGYSLGRVIAVVPGNITSPQSQGTNQLIRDGGNEVHPITSTDDLLSLLGVNEKIMKPQHQAENDYEQAIISALTKEQLSSENLLQASKLEVSVFNIHLTMLEIKGIVEQTSNNSWGLSRANL